MGWVLLLNGYSGFSMAYSFAFMIQKGGVGKTSICGNIAHILSQEHRVLLVDGDPQGSLTSWLMDTPVKKEFVDVLATEELLQPQEITGTLHLLPTCGTTNRLRQFAETALEQSPFIIRDVLTQLDDQYDFMIIDTAPSTSRLERSFLLAVDEVVTPLTPEYFSIDGIQIFQKFFSSVQKNWRIDAVHQHIIINGMNQSYTAHKGYHQQLLTLSDYSIVTVPQDRSIANAQVIHEPVLTYKYTTTCKDALVHAAYQLQNKRITSNAG